MPGIFLAAPAFESLPHDVPVWTGSDMSWLDWQGNVWDLCTGRSGVVLLGAGVRGLTMPPIIRYSQKSPAVSGSRWRGFITDEREIFWPLKVFKDTGSQDWLNHDRKFWQSMRPDKTGVWQVAQPGGEVRSLSCRFVDDGGQAFDTLPEMHGWATYGVSLVAEQPFWSGPTEVRTWSTVTGANFFGGVDAGEGAPFYITSSNAASTATVSNPGDVPSAPVWVVHGPSTLVKVGVGASVVEVPFTVASGEWVVIDTAPTAQTALFGSALDDAGKPLLSAGVDRTADLGAVNFASIPAGESVPLTIQITGAGMVELNLTPQYYRAW
jgi:hypothetical protein